MFSTMRPKKLPLFFYLSASYLVGYALCVFLFYVITVRVLSRSIRAFDREDAESESQEYRDLLNSQATCDGLAEEVAHENFPDATLFAVRVFEKNGKIAFAASQPNNLTFPGGWAQSPQTDTQPPPRIGHKKVYLPDYKRYIQIRTTRLDDGRILQVAKSTDLENMQRHILSNTSLMFFLLASLFTLANGFWMMAITLRPVKQITSEMAKIVETGSFEQGVNAVNSRIAEFISLGEFFNLMIRKNATLIKAMRDTLDNVAHDFRTPLTRIRGNAEVALNAHPPTPENEALLGTLADIIDDCDNARTQLQNLMDIREMESGCVKLDFRTLDMKQLIAGVVELYTLLAEDKDIALSLDMPDGQVPIEGDENRLSQVLANLVDNAVKFTPRGGQVRIALESDASNIRIAVADTGIGIPAEEHALIWQRLYRSRNARNEKGIGLGLSIIRAIVNAHDGQITLTSAPGKGSTFTLVLPVERNNPPIK